MMLRSSAAILAIAITLLASPASPAGDLSEGGKASFAGLLKPDGTLDLTTGYSGSLSPEGYAMSVGADGVPRFFASPEAVPRQQASLRSHTADPDDHWDGRFTIRPGVSGSVEAFAQSGTDLYVGGDFTTVDGMPAGNIARWNGSAWAPLGTGTNGPVTALLVSGSELYVGGDFTTAGGVPANRIAKWNGTNWSALGTGLTGPGLPRGLRRVTALAMLGSDLCVAGNFTSAGATTVNGLAKWNGSAWSALGNGSGMQVRALAAVGSDLYVGGDFTVAWNDSEPIETFNIAKWDGTSWSGVGGGVVGPGSMNDEADDWAPGNASVRALQVVGGDLYVAGIFIKAGGEPAKNVAKWNGSAWLPLDTGLDAEGALALTTMGSELYAATFWSDGPEDDPVARVEKWDGSSWSPAGATILGTVKALAVSGTTLYAGGFYQRSGRSALNGIAQLEGGAWEDVGSGIIGFGIPDGAIYALATSGTELFVAGDFSAVGGVRANGVAKWDGTSWSALGGGMSANKMTVSALAVSGTDLYAAGTYTTISGEFRLWVPVVAKWNGTSWSQLGSPVKFAGDFGAVYTLLANGSDLYAGGLFDSAGGVPANNIAKWDGTTWTSLGEGVSHVVGYAGVRALAVVGADLYAGGFFDTAGAVPASNIARWNGSSWSALATGIAHSMAMDGYRAEVASFAVIGTDLYVGGFFNRAGAVTANNIAKWNGTAWSALGTGLQLPDNPATGWVDTAWVGSLTAMGTNLYAGGAFELAGPTSVNYVARWNGTAWSRLGSGVTSPPAALAAVGTNLYAGGYFEMAGDKPSSRIGLYYTGACGNGVVGAGESCDPLAAGEGLCCDINSCQPATCDDTSLCTSDFCMDDRGCAHEAAPLPEALCLADGARQIQVKYSADPRKNQFKWKWSEGEGFEQSTLGDPGQDTDYTLCLYDTDADGAELVASVSAQRGSSWTSADPKGLKYADKLLAPDGLQKLQIKTGVSGRTQIQATAKGVNLVLQEPASEDRLMSQDPAVIVQLVNDVGTCWSSRFVASGTSKNDGKQFKAKGP